MLEALKNIGGGRNKSAQQQTSELEALVPRSRRAGRHQHHADRLDHAEPNSRRSANSSSR